MPLCGAMTYTPTTGYSGADALIITINDLGNSGIGGPLSATSSVAVNIEQATVTPAPLPQIIDDTGLVTDAHQVAPVTPATLRAAETGALPAQLTFTLTAAPTQGTLSVAGQALGVGGTFTERDIEQGRLTYAPSAARTIDDSFTFIVTDAAGVSLPAAVFQIHNLSVVVPPPLSVLPPPIVVTPNPAVIFSPPQPSTGIPPIDLQPCLR